MTEQPCQVLHDNFCRLECRNSELFPSGAEDACEATRTEMSRMSRTRLSATVSVTVVTPIEPLEVLTVPFFEMVGKCVTERTALCLACLVGEGVTDEWASIEVCPIARVAKKLTSKALLSSMTGKGKQWRQSS